MIWLQMMYLRLQNNKIEEKTANDWEKKLKRESLNVIIDMNNLWKIINTNKIIIDIIIISFNLIIVNEITTILKY